MQQRWGPSGLVMSAAVAAALAMSGAYAVEEPPERGEPGLRDPRVPDSVPNISGVWRVSNQVNHSLVRLAPADGSPTPFLPWAQERVDAYRAAQAAGSPLYDPNTECLPPGVPRIIDAPYPSEIIQTPDRTIILNEAYRSFRIIHMDAEHPEEIEPTFHGHSVGRWEGDTLVIDTIGLTDQSFLDEDGSVHTAQLRVIEHISPIDEETLRWRFTIEDPGAFSETWTAESHYSWQPEMRIFEYVCEENNRNQPTEDGVLSEF